MDRLWAPWRMQYIERELSGNDEGKSECLFCRAGRGKLDKDNLVVYRGSLAYIILNRYPYNNGHVMVVPYRHVLEPGELSKDEALEVHELLILSIEAIKKAMKPDGFNIGVNIGRAAGAGFSHLHYHVVPRWVGDTNFMPVVADVKVLPEHLERTYVKVRDAVEKLLEERQQEPP